MRQGIDLNRKKERRSALDTVMFHGGEFCVGVSDSVVRPIFQLSPFFLSCLPLTKGSHATVAAEPRGGRPGSCGVVRMDGLSLRLNKNSAEAPSVRSAALLLENSQIMSSETLAQNETTQKSEQHRCFAA